MTAPTAKKTDARRPILKWLSDFQDRSKAGRVRVFAGLAPLCPEMPAKASFVAADACARAAPVLGSRP
jgi:hypothetical protein